MAIEPIKAYASSDNGLIQVLQGGSQQLGTIIDRAIQIGKNSADNRMRQEQDMLAMRQQETALAQRRGENLQQNIEDSQRFAFNVFDSNRKFEAATANNLADNSRADASLGIQQMNADRNYELANRRVDLFEDQVATREAEAANKKASLENMATLPGEAPAEAKPAPGTIWDRMAAAGRGVAKDVTEFLTGPSQADEATLLQQQRAAATAEQAAKQLGDPVKLAAAQKQLAESTAGLNQLRKTQRTTTRSPFAEEDQEMQRQNFQNKQKATAEKAVEDEVKQLVLGDTTSFIPQEVAIKTPAMNGGNAEPTAAQIAEAKTYDKDRFASEVASAKRMTLQEYLAKGPQTDAAKAARTKLYQFAHGQAPASAPAWEKYVPR